MDEKANARNMNDVQHERQCVRQETGAS